MSEEKTIVYSYNKDTKTYTISDKEMQKINRKLKERFALKQENKQLKGVIEEVRERSKLERKTALSLNQHYAVSIIDSVLQILDKVKVDNE